MKNKTIAVVITEEQSKWLDDISMLNNRSKSYIVRLAISKLMEIIEER